MKPIIITRWWRRNRQTGETAEVNVAEVRHRLRDYPNLTEAMRVCTEVMPISTSGADYWQTQKMIDDETGKELEK